jgi:hypothetical protein
MDMIGWHVTSRNRANHICLRGLNGANEHDNFGAFEQLGPQLLALCGVKPVYVSCPDLPEISEREFARALHCGPQQLRALMLDLEGLELHIDLPAVCEQLGLRVAGDRASLDVTDPELRELMRKAARASRTAKTVKLDVLCDPRVRDYCIRATSSAMVGQDIGRERVRGTYTIAQARTICDHRRAISRRSA